VDNVDPLKKARIQAMVPSVDPFRELGWAMPCAPFAGPDMGLLLMPPIGANVWIEFEAGDMNYPIWSGCFWSDGELPSEALWAKPPDAVQILKAPGFLFVADRTKNSFSIRVDSPMVGTPASLVFDKSGIELKIADAVVTLTTAHILLQNGTPSVKVSQDAIRLENGAASIKMSPAKVDINDGALEIT